MNNKWMKVIACLAIVAVLLTTVVSCAPATPEVVEKEVPVTVEVEKEVVVEKEVIKEVVVTATPVPVKGPVDTVHVAVRQQTAYRRLDPHDAQGSAWGLWENFYEQLVGVDSETLEFHPLLAESWESTDDGQRWVFHLRRGVRFHDGTDFTSEDVKLSFERELALKLSFDWQRLERIKEIRTPDDYTVEFIIESGGVPFYVDAAVVGIVSADAVREHDVDDFANGWFAENVVGTGPYKLQEWKVNERTVMVRNEDYWGELPYFETAVFLQVPEYTSAVMMIQEGEVDITTIIAPDMLQQLKETPGLRVVEGEGVYPMALRLLCQGDVPTADPHVRRAIAYAMNYPLLYSVRSENFVPTEGPVPSEFLDGWVPSDSLYEYDLDKAREELAKSRYPDGGFEVIVAYERGDEKFRAVMEILQAELAKLNIELNIQATEWSTVRSELLEAKDQGYAGAAATPKYHALTLGKSLGIVDVVNFMALYHSGSSLNFGGYSNPAVDKLLEEADTSTDNDQRIELYKQAIAIILEDSPDIHLGLNRQIEVSRDNIEGHVVNKRYNTWGIDLVKLSRRP